MQRSQELCPLSIRNGGKLLPVIHHSFLFTFAGMKNLIKYAFGLILLAGLLASCSPELKKYNQYSRKGTLSEKDSAAFYFFEQGDCDKASYLLEELQGAYRGQPRAKDVLFTYCQAKYNCGFYIISAYYYEQFSKLYPNEPRTPEATFMVGYCYFLESAPYYRDQEFTNKAIQQFQLFINSYPFHERVQEATELIIQMRERLAEKDFETANLYFTLENFKAAVTSYEVFVSEFPDSRYREEAEYMHFESAYYLANISIASKKKNRFLDAIDYFEAFSDKYPNSVYLKDGEKLYAKAKEALGKIRAEES